ncbi:MAG TPA: DNRLRE domain-containing protein [Roseiflexaceae bacterium]|nr:DNRLRE domain-containing protein [Roseiflexaceae bacterium]
MLRRIALPIAAIILAALFGIALIQRAAPSHAHGGPTTLYVSPVGSDWSSGRAPDQPLQSIQHALDLAQPGDTVVLAAGVYLQDFVSRRDGTAAAPITIKGPADAVVKGGGKSRIAEINHDHVTLEGFTFDGLWGSADTKKGFREKLLYVVGTAPNDGVTGLKVLRMTFRNAGGECLRMRYFAQHNEIGYSRFESCGVHDFKFKAGKRNGEAIYIGTAPEQRSNGENPTAVPDQSSANWIHHNSFDTQGNECVDIKESSSANLVEYNICTGQQDPKSGGFDARGSGNIFRHNESYGNRGAGIRLGGDGASDGIDNQVYDNNLHDNQGGAIKVERRPQQLCGNRMANNRGGDMAGDAAAACGSTGGAPPAQPAVAAPAARPSYHPTVDTYISSAAAASSYVDHDRFKIDRTPEMWSLLRFELPPGARPRRVLIQLFAQQTVKHGGAIYAVSGEWPSGVTWESRPALGARLAEIGKLKKNRPITVDVTGALQSSGIVSLAILPTSDHVASFYSAESSPARSPKLIVEQ